MTINIDIEYVTRIEDENKKLKEQVDNLRQDLQNRCDRCIELNNDKRYWLDNFKRVRDDKIKLINENTNLQNELFSEHLKQVETEDFIDKLKKELKEYRGF